MKFISGVFFQEYEGVLLTGCGDVLTASKRMKNMFTGVILPEEQNDPPGELDGYISELPRDTDGYIFDFYGFADILDYQESETKISFIKKYEHRPDFIFYSFKLKEGDEWLGTWVMKQDGEIINKGYASCVLVPVSDQMFSMERFLNIPLRKKL